MKAYKITPASQGTPSDTVSGPDVAGVSFCDSMNQDLFEKFERLNSLAVSSRDILFLRKYRSAFHREKRKRRLVEARSKSSHTASQWANLCSELEYKCARCLSSEGIQKDHIIPIYMGGSDGIENLQPLCIRCNAAKGSDSFNWVNFRRKTSPCNAL
jgi:hypothetical protein